MDLCSNGFCPLSVEETYCRNQNSDDDCTRCPLYNNFHGLELVD